MKHRCFDCGQELQPIVYRKDSYLCENCCKIWFLQRIHTICYKCGSMMKTEYELVSFNDYQSKPVITEPAICMMCYTRVVENED